MSFKIQAVEGFTDVKTVFRDVNNCQCAFRNPDIGIVSVLNSMRFVLPSAWFFVTPAFKQCLFGRVQNTAQFFSGLAFQRFFDAF